MSESGIFAEFRLDSRGVRQSFDRASAGYDAAAALQTRVRAELLERITDLARTPHVVLDLGAGTGLAARALKSRFGRAVVLAVDIAPGMLREQRRQQRLLRRFARICGDARRLPLADASVDLVFSNLMLQWCDELDTALREVRRVLRPGGLFSFSTFGPDTLMELRTAWAAADGFNHVNRFIDMHDVGDAMLRAGLTEPVLDVDRLQIWYPEVLELMRDLKAIGAHNVTAGRARGLTGRARLARMRAAYETRRSADGLPVTYEVIYGAAWGPAAHATAGAIRGETRIAPSAIRRPGPR